MGWLKHLSDQVKDLDPTNKNSAVRKELVRFDNTVLQPSWNALAWAALDPVLRTIGEAYIKYHEDQAAGKYKPLPLWLRAVLDDLDAYDVDMNLVHYAENISTFEDNAVTIGYNIHFPREISIERESIDSDDLEWILHELEHVVQYKRTGGVAPFLAKYVIQSTGSAITNLSSNWKKYVISIHDNVELEKDAQNKAESLLPRVLETEKILGEVIPAPTHQTFSGPNRIGTRPVEIRHPLESGR
jgi:Domain of unknown function (DUF4157)